MLRMTMEGMMNGKVLDDVIARLLEAKGAKQVQLSESEIRQLCINVRQWEDFQLDYGGEFDNSGALLSVDESLMCSFEIMKPLDKPSSSKSSGVILKKNQQHHN